MDEVKISEGSNSNCNTFNPITGGFTKLPSNSDLNSVNAQNFCEVNFDSVMTNGYTTAGSDYTK